MTKMLTLVPNLMVDNVEQTIKFYQSHLQFELVNSVPAENGYAWAMLKRDAVVLMLHETTNIKEEYYVFSDQSPGGSFVLYISIDDIESFYTNFDKSFVIKDLHTTFYNMREFAIQDNNGYVLTFAEKLEQ